MFVLCNAVVPSGVTGRMGKTHPPGPHPEIPPKQHWNLHFNNSLGISEITGPLFEKL